MEGFGAIIRDWRGELTQTQAAKKIAEVAGKTVLQQDVSRWERGGGTDDVDVVAAVAELAGVPVDQVEAAARTTVTLDQLAADLAAFRALFLEKENERIAVGRRMAEVMAEVAMTLHVALPNGFVAEPLPPQRRRARSSTHRT
jgi:hypothetical protein